VSLTEAKSVAKGDGIKRASGKTLVKMKNRKIGTATIFKTAGAVAGE
jgi:hypothetical protein